MFPRGHFNYCRWMRGRVRLRWLQYRMWMIDDLWMHVAAIPSPISFSLSLLIFPPFNFYNIEEDYGPSRINGPSKGLIVGPISFSRPTTFLNGSNSQTSTSLPKTIVVAERISCFTEAKAMPIWVLTLMPDRPSLHLCDINRNSVQDTC